MQQAQRRIIRQRQIDRSTSTFVRYLFQMDPAANFFCLTLNIENDWTVSLWLHLSSYSNCICYLIDRLHITWLSLMLTVYIHLSTVVNGICLHLRHVGCREGIRAKIQIATREYRGKQRILLLSSHYRWLWACFSALPRCRSRCICYFIYPLAEAEDTCVAIISWCIALPLLARSRYFDCMCIHAQCCSYKIVWLLTCRILFM